jgi:hypothetical protein
MSRAAQPTAIAEEKFCVFCGYNLHGITSERCPECGKNVVALPPIPWANRANIGRFRAFFQTLWLATFRPAKLTQAATTDKEYASAERFRWIVVALIALPLAALVFQQVWQNQETLWALSSMQQPGLVPELRELWCAGAALAGVLPLGIVISTLLGTAALGYWFEGRNRSITQRNRAIALSRYASAPLVWFVPIVAILWLTAPMIDDLHGVYFLGPIGITYALTLAVLFLAWRTPLVLLRHATRCGAGRLAVAAIGLPLTWAIAVLIGLGLLPAVVGLLAVIIQSLHIIH